MGGYPNSWMVYFDGQSPQERWRFRTSPTKRWWFGTYHPKKMMVWGYPIFWKPTYAKTISDLCHSYIWGKSHLLTLVRKRDMVIFRMNSATKCCSVMTFVCWVENKHSQKVLETYVFLYIYTYLPTLHGI